MVNLKGQAQAWELASAGWQEGLFYSREEQGKGKGKRQRSTH